MAKKEVGVVLEEDDVDRIDGLLEYGDSRSEWIREAIREKLERIEEQSEE